MILHTYITIAGLVGFTLALSVSHVSRGVAEWLTGFEKVYNPLLWVGHVMSCTLVTGMSIGFVWGWWSPFNPIVAGGLIAVLSYAADELLALMDSSVRALMARYFSGGGQQQAGLMASEMLRRHAPPPPKVVEKEVVRHRPLTEEEAHSAADAEEDRADRMGPMS